MKKLISILISIFIILIIFCCTIGYSEQKEKYIKKESIGYFIRLDDVDNFIKQSAIITEKARIRIFGEPSYIPKNEELYIQKEIIETKYEWKWFKYKGISKDIKKYLILNNEKYSI